MTSIATAESRRNVFTAAPADAPLTADDRDRPMINVRGLTKSYDNRQVVCGIDLEVRRGEVLALLGPNGAGKTTTIEILEGYRRRDGGSVEVAGCDPCEPDRGWRDRVGVVLQSTGAFGELTVREVLDHFARFYADPVDPSEAMSVVGLDEQSSTRCRRLSGGQRRRLDLALGIIGNPEVLFLDEPTTGLDPAARRRIWKLIDHLTSMGRTTVLTTHYLDEAEALAQRVALISDGCIVAEGSPRTLGRRDEAVARITFEASGGLAGRSLPDLGDDRVEFLDGSTVVEVASARPTDAILTLARWAAHHGEPELPGLTIRRATLEDIYLGLTRSGQTE